MMQTAAVVMEHDEPLNDLPIRIRHLKPSLFMVNR